MERRLAAILVADAVGYSQLMGEDEEATLRALQSARLYIDETIGRYSGRIFGSAGDSVIAEFQSPVEAVKCALDIQLRDIKSDEIPSDPALRFRIGIHLDDIMVDGDNLLGDGVNIAARLEALAPPEGICISKTVAEQVLGKIDADFADTGSHSLKNIAKNIDIFVWPPKSASMVSKRPTGWKSVAVLSLAAFVLVAAVFFHFGLSHDDQLPTGPRIVVTPFKNIGNNPEDTYFSDGLTRDLNSLLAKFSNLFVIAPEATVDFREGFDCKRIRDELGADYILSGAVQRSATKLRVTTNFTDAKTCRQLTSPGPFEADLNVSSVMDIQLEIGRKVAAQIGSSDAPIFKSSVIQSLHDKAPGSMAAYECYLLSFWFYETWAVEDFRRARDCLLETVREEPGYSLGWSRLAFNHIESKKRGHDTLDDWDSRAREAVDKALGLDRDNPDAYYAKAVLSRMVGDEQAFEINAQKAIDLNPNDSWILADLGIFLCYSGDWEKGKAWITKARSLNPKLHPGFGYAWHLHALARDDYPDAIDQLALAGGAKNSMSMASLIATYALNGERDKAVELAKKFQQRFPDKSADPLAPFRARRMPAELIEKISKGLKLAGVAH